MKLPRICALSLFRFFHCTRQTVLHSKLSRGTLLFLLGNIVTGTAIAQQATDGDSEQAESTEKAPPKEETVERELEAGEDPLAQQTSELHEQPGFWYRDHTSLKPYGSVRYRYAISDDSSGFDDAGSRFGLSGELQWKEGFWLLGRAEVGFNLFEELNEVISASGRLSDSFEDMSARLIYGGVSTPSTTLTFGKNWSSYYQVSGLTDRFSDYGGEASGTYNALTDGGPTGTGRADTAFQGRFSVDSMAEYWNLKPFKLNVQYQPGEEIPQTDGFDYQQSAGFSALLETQNGSFLGIAYNHAVIDEADLPALRSQGIDGDAQALILGSRRFGDDYYMAMTITWMENHETTDAGTYFDGWGWEGFASRRIAPKWWFIGGWNALTPHGDQTQAGEYQLLYGVIGLRYTFDEFRRMIYSELRIDDSYNEDGSKIGNIFSLGVRWDLP